MREVNFQRDVVYGVAHLLGIDPEEDLLKDHARSWASTINSKVREGWGFWEWPEFEVTEERAFRQVFYSTVTYQSGQGEGSEVYYPPTQKYYRMTTNAAAGTLPTDATKWAEITSAQLDRHIAFEQYGKQDIDRIVSVDPTDPRLSPSEYSWRTRPSSYGTDLPVWAGPTVWVTYIPRPPLFSADDWSSATAYRRGDVVFDLTSGDCFRALIASTNQAPSTAVYWLRQVFPYVLAEYVKYSVAAEQAGDVQQKAQWMAEADNRLKAEVDKLIGQGLVSYYGPRRRVYHLQGVAALPA